MRYELIYIIPGSLSEADRDAAIAKVDALTVKHGLTVARKDAPAKLKIAYPMTRERYGYFVRVELEGDGVSAAALTPELQLIPDLIRLQVIKLAGGKSVGPATLISHEDANARAREMARTAAAHRAAPVTVAPPVAAPLPPAVKLTEEQIEEKIEKILSDDSLQGV